VLRGSRPLLSVEITKECPLHCPGCYAYEPNHLGAGLELARIGDYRGAELVRRFLGLVRDLRPLHVSIVGGEPLVRYRELDEILPELNRMGIEVQLVTSAVRPIPAAWKDLGNLHLVVSVDGLQPEHDARRAPATYDRIRKNIAGHSIIVHCTVTRQMLARGDSMAEFATVWSERPEVRRIWFSLYTPQNGDCSKERLTPEDRRRAIETLGRVRRSHPKVHLPEVVLRGFASPPASPAECIFSQVTTCLSADFRTQISPCQFGGDPVCAECGCIASAGLSSVGAYRLAGLVRVSDVFAASRAIGRRRRRARPASGGNMDYAPGQP
jgi:MoaA/NifB/PqqE/SkfB family radical SAM enzyme